MTPLRWTAAALFAAVAITLIVVLAIGVESRVWRLVILGSACVAVTSVVVAIPASVRARAGFITATFLGAVGVVPLFVNEDAEPPAGPAVNVNYLAVLLRQGPVQPDLPRPLKAGKIISTSIADPTAARAVVTLKVEMASESIGVEGAGGYIELYRTKEEAATRSQARFETLKKQYAPNIAVGDGTKFCVEGNEVWFCGATRGYVLVEAAVSPFSNANQALASSAVAVLLTYCDDQTLRAIT